MSHTRAGRSEDPALTEELDVTIGIFEVGNYRVPYLSAVVPLTKVAAYFNLVTDNPKFVDQDWSLTELFQRDINHHRVDDIASHYLNAEVSNRPPFFNSITVVLMRNGNGSPESQIEFKTASAEFNTRIDLGPIALVVDRKGFDGVPLADGAFGILRWHTDYVQAVAIDGQHRVAAIKEANKKKSLKGSVSVLFVLLDPAAGFAPVDFAGLRAMRSIFIDLNKHAVPVGKTRNLLLDDRDPEARFVRSIVGERLDIDNTQSRTDEGFPVGNGGEFVSCMPLSLIDWHNDGNVKVDTGPYVASLLTMHWMVRLLTSNAVPNVCTKIPDLYPDDENYYVLMEKALKTWSSFKGEFKSRFQEMKNEDLPFNLEEEELQSLSEEFRQKWGKPLVRLLTKLKPYQKLIDARMKANSLDHQFPQWYQVYSAHQRAQRTKGKPRVADALQTNLKDVEDRLRANGKSRRAYEELLAECNRVKEPKENEQEIAFLLVGQRALVYAYAQLVASGNGRAFAKAANIKLERFEHSLYDFYSYYLVSAMNALIDAEGRAFRTSFSPSRNKKLARTDLGLPTEFWAGSITYRDAPTRVDFSESAAQRASKWIVLISHVYWAVRSRDAESRKTLQDAVGAVITNSAKPLDTIKVIPSHLRNALLDVRGDASNRIKNRNTSPVEFMTRMLDDTLATDHVIMDATTFRVHALLELFAAATETDDA